MAFIAFEMHLLPSTYNSASNGTWFVMCRDLVSHLFKPNAFTIPHYNDVIMSLTASQITSLMIVYSTVYSDTDQRKHQSSVSLAFVRWIHRGPVKSPHKGPVTRKMFPFDDVIMGAAIVYYSIPVSWVPCSQQRRCARKTGLRSQGSLAKFLVSL